MWIEMGIGDRVDGDGDGGVHGHRMRVETRTGRRWGDGHGDEDGCKDGNGIGMGIEMRTTSCRNRLRKQTLYGRRMRTCFNNSLQPKSRWD